MKELEDRKERRNEELMNRIDRKMEYVLELK